MLKKWTLKEVKEMSVIIVDPPSQFKSDYWKQFKMIYANNNTKITSETTIFGSVIKQMIFWKNVP